MTWLDASLFLIPLLHLLVSPHTKVEESFNLQATHDILVYGIPLRDPLRLQAFDHSSFPGAVPRTFVGPVVLAGLSQLLIELVGFQHAQLVARGVLGVFNAASLLVFRRCLSRAFGDGVGAWWTALMVGQFHIMYYLTRTLPNMFAFGLTTLAAAFTLPRADARTASIRRRQAVGLLVMATAVFRAEIAILLSATGLHMLLTRRISLAALVAVGLGSLLAALLLSVPLDSFFWQRPLWPELAAFHYNAVLGASSNWGTSPWHFYFSSALPRLLLNPLALPLVAASLLLPGTARQARALVLAPLLFVAVYSLQPHKEARFVFYAVPPLTAAAALAANFVALRAAKSPLYRLGLIALLASLLVSLAASHAMLLLSALNYPGGDAVAQLYRQVADGHPADTVAVHADVLTCMTGLTLFGQNPHGLPLALEAPAIVFDKTEDTDALASPDFWTHFDYLLMEEPRNVPSGAWAVTAEIHGYDGVEVLRPGQASHPANADAAAAADVQGARRPYPVAGLGAAVRDLRAWVRQRTRGWWAGPRLSPRIYIMKRVQEDAR
ncbi:putative Dol-P-Man:Man(7)GlcNAc(2)-PP-Dol alpha-1 [Escovopsis weberi]|uniref:Mannosyltransferase n=1 Tax=Escovopsis weberi TaxID=150374 RepID=A0A0M8MZI7_ESCWE|nr:putative Dol-P-Man:Man(7)GlcNAc(2)-PP-Dol alpha-1 [Escovopsis weberi]